MQSSTKIKVRYAETDQMGVVHHSNYPVWFEIGRTEFLSDMGYSYSTLEKEGVLLPLTEITCKYKTPARYGESVIIKTAISYLSHVKIGFSYEVINAENDKLIATGETCHGWTDCNMKPIVIQKARPRLYGDIKKYLD